VPISGKLVEFTDGLSTKWGVFVLQNEFWFPDVFCCPTIHVRLVGFLFLRCETYSSLVLRVLAMFCLDLINQTRGEFLLDF